jgi:hypothetical protein
MGLLPDNPSGDGTRGGRAPLLLELNWDGARKRTSFWRGEGSR